MQIDHVDPRWREGIKEQEGYEQLVCGLYCEANLHEITIHENSSKSDRFLPIRVIKDAPLPMTCGDYAYFLCGDEWRWLEFLGDEWYAEATATGRFNAARSGRNSVERRDGFIGWRERQDQAALDARDKKMAETIRAKIKNGDRWGWMLPENTNCAGGGIVGGPRTAKPENVRLRSMYKIIVRGDVQIVCERGEIASRICEKILKVAPECAPISPKDIHRIWAGKMSKDWTLEHIEP